MVIYVVYSLKEDNKFSGIKAVFSKYTKAEKYKKMLEKEDDNEYYIHTTLIDPIIDNNFV